MMTPKEDEIERWEDLQIARLLEGLTPEELAELDLLTAKMPDHRLNQFDQVVAKIDLVWSDTIAMPLPEHLRKAIRERAEHEVMPKPRLSEHVSDHRRAKSNFTPWLISAACLMITVVTWLSTKPTEVKIDRNDIAKMETSSESRIKLIASAKDLVKVDWKDGPTPIPGAKGDVVWSAERQQGYLRFQGLTANDPKLQQYQLWIFDENQKEATPVDGGVFDISSEDEMIVPIQPKLHVVKAYLFAVTIEKPGGVVVSSRERLPLIASVN